MIVLPLGTGVFLSLRLRFPQVRRIGAVWHHTISRVLHGQERDGEGTIASSKAG